MSYDIIIVGAGVSGLYLGIELKKRYPQKSCCILEKYSETGGRINTFHTNVHSIGPVQWESGAGRIATTHRMILSLIKRYRLHTFPMTSAESSFELLKQIYLEPLKNLPIAVLQCHTLFELLCKIYGEKEACDFAVKFPYTSEISVLRADRAFISFDNEMKSTQHFLGCKEGIAAITNKMAEEFIQLGGSIQYNTAINEVYSKNATTHLLTKNTTFTAKDKCILAVTSTALKGITGLSNLPVLNKLCMQPLLRIYAVFPVNGKKISWFSGMSRVVTASPIRYFIPINSEKGIAMISYTDGADTKNWMDIPANLRLNAVMTALRALFPGIMIPDPLYSKEHYWGNGCTYWKPGKYDVAKESDASVKPFKNRNIYLCGESFAENQCWIESALEQAVKVLNRV
jgi:monoamine oxidase